MICIAERSGLSSARDAVAISRASKRTLPLLGGMSCKSALPVVVFPQPDSPTSASVRPSASSKDTPSTAFT
jgi:hypothetical protein